MCLYPQFNASINVFCISTSAAFHVPNPTIGIFKPHGYDKEIYFISSRQQVTIVLLKLLLYAWMYAYSFATDLEYVNLRYFWIQFNRMKYIFCFE